MDDMQEKITGYIAHTLDIPLGLKKIKLGGLPLYLRDEYVFYNGKIHNKEIVFAVANSNGQSTPSEYQKKQLMLESAASLPVVFVFESLPAYNRDRLIKGKVSFIVPGKQMFMPHLMIDLRESFPAEKTVPVQSLTPVAQCMVLYHILKEPLDNLALRDIGKKLSYSAMSVSRAVKELQEHGIINKKKNTRNPLTFLPDKKEIWNIMLPLAINPVSFIFNIIKDYNWLKSFLKAGESALSVYSNLNDPPYPVYAATPQSFKKVKPDVEIINKTEPVPEIAPVIQIWKYNPSLLSDANAVDPLSLYLSMRDSTDERIQIALEKMLKKVMR